MKKWRTKSLKLVSPACLLDITDAMKPTKTKASVQAKKFINLLVDSQAAIMTIRSTSEKSRFVRLCKDQYICILLKEINIADMCSHTEIIQIFFSKYIFNLINYDFEIK